MNKIILLVFLFFATNFFAAENPFLELPIIDKRVELLSIVFRLSGSPEYNSKVFKIYTEKIEKHFKKYKKHELIKFVKKIKKKDNLGYDAVMTMAIYISPAPDFIPLISFSEDNLDARWNKKKVLKFIELLKKFYIDSDCETFFQENEDLYKEVYNNFLPVYNNFDISWYKNFYGKESNEKFKIVIGLGNGDGNYGPEIQFANGKREIYAIMGTWSIDSLGKPKYAIAEYFPILLHEFNHSFINYLTEKDSNSLNISCEKIYKKVKTEMERQSYTDWKMMISEALVRASVIKYMIDHNFNKLEIEKEIQRQLDNNFFWINELVVELNKYDSQRDKFPTLEDYMPNLILFYNNLANLN